MKKEIFQILVVDDNKAILNSLEFLLQFKYEKIICISNPNQINEKLRSNQIDLVLLDMNFKPGSNSGNEGLFWLNEIRKFDETISIILITAYGDINLAVKGVKQGASDFIVKPWENEKLNTIWKITGMFGFLPKFRIMNGYSMGAWNYSRKGGRLQIGWEKCYIVLY